MTHEPSAESIDTTSFWTDSATLPRFPKLTEDLSVDVVVVGAGITGVTAAYLLRREGYEVALLERDRVGGVDTSHTTAHLTAVTDRRLHRLVRQWGEPRTKAVWDAGMAAIDRIAANIADEGIACEFEWIPGYLHAPVGSNPAEERRSLEQDAETANRLGIRAAFLAHVPVFDQPGVEFPGQAKFHPLQYLSALLRAITDGGKGQGRESHVFEHTPVTEVKDAPLGVKAGDHFVRCRYVILATHTPLSGKTNPVSALLLQTKLYLYTSYVIGARVPRGALPQASFWDTGDPYRYLRVDRRRGSEYVVLGGEDHKTGQNRDPADSYRRLEEILGAIVPGAEVDHRWSGQVVETPDGLPYLGETADHQFAATGFAGNGMTFGTLGAMMAVDAFLGRRNPWRELFVPDRKKMKGSILTFLDENKDYPYYLLRDRLARDDPKSLRSVRRDQGKIVDLDGKKVAAYRDEHGKVTLCSPVCTHLGCIVRWNDLEKTWDCPCHGSRFTALGKVMSGPAEEDLGPAPRDGAA